jgi:hypothetical protein
MQVGYIHYLADYIYNIHIRKEVVVIPVEAVEAVAYPVAFAGFGTFVAAS